MQRTPFWLAPAWIFLAATMPAPPAAPASPSPVRVFAANGTVEVVQKIGDAFTRKTGTPVEVSGGTSPALSSRILSGADADLFVSSSRGTLSALLRAHLVDEDSSFLWATNSLMAISPAGAQPPRSVQEIASPRFRRIALPDPDSTVAGPFVREALRTAGIWEEVHPRTVNTEDADKAMALLESGGADLAIVYATDARRRFGSRAMLPLPPDSHQAIPYPVVLIGHPGASPQARPLLDFLKSSEARALLVEAGFTPAF